MNNVEQESNINQTIAMMPGKNREITELLLEVGFPHHLYGFSYIAYALELVMLEPHKLHHITKEIYPDVARHFGTAPSRVERAIRTAVQTVWVHGNKQLINAIFRMSIRPDKGYPTNTQLLAALCYYLQDSHTQKPA